MSSPNNVIGELRQLQSNAPAGFALAFHIDYTRPTFLFQTYPDAWISEYSEKGLVMSDPTVLWAFENEGCRRWSELTEHDGAGVLDMAAKYGLQFGATCAVEAGNTRSMCSFARSDREYTDAECQSLLESIAFLHDATRGMTALPEHLSKEFAEMGIRVSQPGGK
ncbi:Autoinducer binding domain-containing protein [Cognatiyoonia koreensis]|uniref:Autoinducer binding domain-containing protein n=1 Tax=Cognatiyoonia koreensis TaxID=364200 RepID=A0A1I0NQ88_9RHOB|nr:autoinducer binding domain-containing protein [Cognatiyoonia koreensis]SEW03481.1 Autoinducer binding domain-containing protein [Cognatiyoonia koreensis]